jgi:hypothetical protein
MATARDLILRSFRELGITDGFEDASAEDAAVALDTLNDMIGAWELDGIPTGLGTLTLNTALAVPDNHLEAMRANLSARLAPVFGRQAPPMVVEMASRGLRALQGAYSKVRLLSVDPGIRSRRAPYGRVF